MEFPEDLKYTKEHEWIRPSGDTGTVGITDYAQSQLGDVVFLELPAVGKVVKQGEHFGTIEAVKTVSGLFAPVSGEISEINPALAKTPELVNKDPYNEGWMIRMKISNRSELGKLLDASAYRKLTSK